MANMFDRTKPPISPLGPGFSSGGRFAAIPKYADVGVGLVGSSPPGVGLEAVRGILPVMASYQADDTITQVGRVSKVWVPDAVAWEFFSRATTRSPHVPLSTQGPIVAGSVTLTLTGPTPAGFTPPDTYLGLDWRICGVTIDISTNNNINPSPVTLELSGVFESMEPYFQHAEVNPGHLGVSRYVLFFTHELQGGAYPQLLILRKQVEILKTGTVITFEGDGGAGPQTLAAPVRIFDVDISTFATGNDGIGVREETLSPVSSLWDWALGLWYSTEQAGG